MAHTFLLAPNAFKGCMSAFSFCSILGQALNERGFNSIPLPLGDGGDGTAEIIAHYLQADAVRAKVPDALGRLHEATYYMRGKTAIIELAEACGIKLLKRKERDVLNANTQGMGTLVNHALQCGARDFILCVGGSASVDGGLGALVEMGLEAEIEGGQRNYLLGVKRLHVDSLRNKFSGIRFTILCDVENPLVGPTGSAAVFGPQKGATPEQVALLDSLLSEYADMLQASTGHDVIRMPMGGAAGGITASFRALLDADLVSGADYCLSISHFDERLAEVQAVVTGEGHLDSQSLGGKIPGTVARVCKAHDMPVYAVAGVAEKEAASCFNYVLTFSSLAASTADSIKNAPYYLKLMAEPLIDAFYSGFHY